MTLLNKPEDIWVLKPTKEDLIAGAKYAEIAMPWTFNRMMMNSGSRGQQSRALNIAKGIVGQEMLRRELARHGTSPQVQRKSYRDEDLFDFHLPIDGVRRKLDVKSVNYYTNYDNDKLERVPLSASLIISNANYPGPNWQCFFPMLVPHTQIGQDKEAYCFAIASSIDFRRDIDYKRIGHSLTAFPYGRVLPFFTSKQLCCARENADKGFYLRCLYTTESLFNGNKLPMTILGEWNGTTQKLQVDLYPDEPASDIGPFSCVTSFQIERADYDRLHWQIEASVCRNDFTAPVLNSARRNINVEPDPDAEKLTIRRYDFCNLMLPTDYTVYFIGWIMKTDFLQACRQYTGWVWPNDRVNKFENQSWSQITEDDKKSIVKAGFADCIQAKPHLLKAGWMKTNGKGGGACCYVFPNIGRHGGVKETNLYVLPRDLRVMIELCR